MSKNFLIILAVLVLGFIGFVVFQDNDGNKPNNSEVSSTASQHTKGAGNKKVTLVEYADFQCPSCAVYFPILKSAKDKYGDDITFQFRHFPLTQIHPNAMATHRAAEAASRQGKFWEMHNVLFERQQAWAQAPNVAQIMEDYATELGMNTEQFKRDYQSSQTNDVINADIAEGGKLKVSGTPTFFLNGEKLDNQSIQTPDDLYKKIDDAIKQAASTSN
jgi:protein-disulfide isomerase